MGVNLHHVGISVSVLDRAIAFYAEVFDAELVERARFQGERYAAVLGVDNPVGTVAVMRRGSLEIELFQFDRPSPKPNGSPRAVADIGISHFCVQVSEIEAHYARLAADGVRLHGPPVDFPGVGKAVYGRDPDGNIFELFEPDSKTSSEERAVLCGP